MNTALETGTLFTTERAVNVAGLGKLIVEDGYEATQQATNAIKKTPALLTQEGKSTAQVIREVARRAKNTRTKFKGIYEKNTKHIFRNKAGHFRIDTPKNRKLLIEMVTDEKNHLGATYAGQTRRIKHWYSKITKEGKQIWAEVIDGEIRNAGINDTPKIFNPETGLTKQFITKKARCHE